MSLGWLVFLLGLILGLGFGGTIGCLLGYRTGHLDGYQDHRAETIEHKNAADARRAPGAELEIRAKTYPLPAFPAPPSLGERAIYGPPWGALPSAVPGGGRPFPRASSRVATTAADIGPVFLPRTDLTVIPLRPQPGRDSGPGTVALPKVGSITGEMRAVTDDLIARMRAGTWP